MPSPIPQDALRAVEELAGMMTINQQFVSKVEEAFPDKDTNLLMVSPSSLGAFLGYHSTGIPAILDHAVGLLAQHHSMSVLLSEPLPAYSPD